MAALGGDGGTAQRQLLLTRLDPVFQAIAAAGGSAAAVGGAVRDTFLGRLTSDIDVATSLPPEAVLAAFPGAVATGVAFGTVTVAGAGFTCHITTYRSEGGYRDARHPERVAFGVSLEEDLARRDFTMNAVALCPDGRIVDPHGGRQDIARGIIRAVGDPRSRLAEDALRMLRALRFESELCFIPEPALGRAIVADAPRISRVHAERIWPELARLVLGPCAERAVARGLPVLAAILPGVRARPLSDLPGDAIIRLCRLCAGAPPDQVAGRLASMAAGKGEAKRAGRLLGYLAKPPADEPYDLRRAATTAGREDLQALAALGGGTWAASAAIALQEPGLFRLAISGSDIKRTGGRPAGPWVGKMFSELWDLVWQDPRRNDREHLMEAVRTRLRTIRSDRED